MKNKNFEGFQRRKIGVSESKKKLIALLLAIVVGTNAIVITNAKAQDDFNGLTPIIKGQDEVVESTIKEWVMDEVANSGLDPFEAYVIIQAESGWREDICIIEPNNTISCGIFMLNTVHNKGGLTNACKVDYRCATKFAIAKRLRDGNWCAWSVSHKLGLCN